ncbi:MAG: DUF4825 domain-containing protein [Caryophanon sp.]|nr:DUF4825 domain-containing protein [Caryophanon sp.]
MKRMILLGAMLLLLVACSEQEQQGVFSYKNTYIGDASSVRAVVEQVDGAAHFIQMELYTDMEPYGVQLHYDELTEEQMLTNGTYLFSLIQNVDWVHYTVGEQAYELSREQINDTYGIDVRNIHDEAALRELIEQLQKQ